MIDDLLGVAYAQGGRWREGLMPSAQRLDCWGLILEIMRRQGVMIPDTFPGQTQMGICRLQAGLSGLDWIASLFGQWRRIDGTAVGSLAVFRNVDGAAAHVGIIVEPGRFLHCTKGSGVSLNRLNRPPWDESLLGCYTYAC